MSQVLTLPHGRLTRFAAAQHGPKPALILCPGGGYEFCSIREGAPAARAFARDGVESFVLEYDCAPVPLDTMPLHTLASAVAWVRRNAAQLGVAPDRIAVGGFSAGAHLAGTLAAVWHRPEWFAPDTDLQCHRPDAAVLCYPVVTAGEYGHRGSFARLAGADLEKQRAFSLEMLVDARTPPEFLWHTLEDQTVRSRTRCCSKRRCGKRACRMRYTCFRMACMGWRWRIWKPAIRQEGAGRTGM